MHFGRAGIPPLNMNYQILCMIDVENFHLLCFFMTILSIFGILRTVLCMVINKSEQYNLFIYSCCFLTARAKRHSAQF